MLLGSDDNENKLRGAEGGSPKEEPSGYGDNKLFETTNNTQSVPEDEDLVKDSFMLSMKANDPESVSEKLNTAAAEAQSSAPDFFGDDDELSNFVPDSSISAFKPLGDNVPSFDDSPKTKPSIISIFASCLILSMFTLPPYNTGISILYLFLSQYLQLYNAVLLILKELFCSIIKFGNFNIISIWL